MNAENTTDATLAALKLSDQLGPLPPHMNSMNSGTFAPLYTVDQMRGYAAREVAAERERCARTCEDEARLWEADGKGPATEARLCAARIRSLASRIANRAPVLR